MYPAPVTTNQDAYHFRALTNVDVWIRRELSRVKLHHLEN